MAADEGVRMPSEIRMFEVEALLPYARNSRKHSPAQIEALAGTIQRVGWTTPILVADGGILAGHGRIMAAKKLGLSRVPGIDLSHLADDERRALVISDNRLAEMATWDLDVLKLETDDLRAAGYDLELYTGFAEEDLAKLFEGMVEPEKPGGGDPDDVPPVPDEPHSHSGDVWVCGPHRIAAGDSTDPAVWCSLLGDELVDVVVTDPPYGVDLDRKNRLMDGAVGGKRSGPKAIENDELTGEEFSVLIGRAYACLFEAMKPGATIYVCHSDKEGATFRNEFDKAGFRFSQNIIWKKNQLVLGMARYQPMHEPILVGRKPGSKSRWYGGRKQTTVMEMGDVGLFRRLEDGRWSIKAGDSVLIVSGEATVEEHPSTIVSVAKPAKSGLHQSQKPVELIERLLRNSARPGDIVVDAFGGSGAIMIAADRMGMCARLVEVAPQFVDVAVRRWEMLTGRRAVHAVTGEHFPRDGEVRAPADLTEPAPDEDDGQPF